MGNSCTREDQVVLSESHAHGQRHPAHGDRGRWSAPDAVESVDLDTLLEAPSPPPSARERRQRSRDKSRHLRKQSSAEGGPGAGGRPPRPPNHRRGRAGSSKRARAQTERRKAPAMLEEEAPVYHSYEDPGYLGGDIELTHFDSDCILGSPPDSPTVIHARWGEPVDDPDEESVCTEYTPNPFKLGFCINCQKQHDVTDSGDVVGKKAYKKIARPAVAKSAASALDNPAALANAGGGPDVSPSHPPGGRESDVDLAGLLQQRRDVLLKLTKLEQEQARIKKGTAANHAPVSAKRTTLDPTSSRHTMVLPDSGNTSLGHLRRVGSRPPASGPIVHRGTSVVLSPRPTSMRGISKSVSWGSRLLDADEEPAQNDWL